MGVFFIIVLIIGLISFIMLREKNNYELSVVPENINTFVPKDTQTLQERACSGGKKDGLVRYSR